MIDGLCQRWGSPPSVILAQPAHLVLGMMAVLEAAGDLQQSDVPSEGDGVKPVQTERDERVEQLAGLMETTDGNE